MEPWRCKRTDGKKWRCSRNVIPDQKYCERHTHKSRGPRSKKHVESSSSSHQNDARTAKNDVRPSFPQFYGQPVSHFPPPPLLTPYDHQGELKWLMKEKSDSEMKRGFGYDLNFRQEEPVVDRSFGALEGLLSLNQNSHHSQETRRFFVEGEGDEAMGSSLSLSMAGGGGMEEGEGVNQHHWASHEGPSWVCSTSTPGGPLAEALCLGVSNNPSTSTTSSCSRSSS